MGVELRLCGGVLLSVGAPDDDAGASLGHRIGHAEADASISPGDQRHLPGQIDPACRLRPNLLLLVCSELDQAAVQPPSMTNEPPVADAP